MDTSVLWNNEEPVTDLGIEVPKWIDQDIDPATVAAIVQGGCASGAYMPAVTYHQALATMAEYGDDVFDYIANVYEDDVCGILQQQRISSWAGMACALVSLAVELWASSVEDEIARALEE